MWHELDRKREIVDIYVEDENGKKVHEALSFKEFRSLFDDIKWEIDNPIEDGKR